MNILIIGSGGREHVLAWKVKKSPLIEKLYCAPGNAGISEIAECVDIEANDIEGLVKFAKKNKINLTIVGPEAPLVDGIVDRFEKEKLMVFGPSQAAARLEGSKVFAKEFMQRCNIPTAQFRAFEDPSKAREFIQKAHFPLVIKADGLAAGKGVIVCKDIKEADAAISRIMEEKVFKEAGEKIIIEECLVGEEVSILAISDGENYVILQPSQDHKRIFDDDLGPNTGGMGAYCPTPLLDEVSLKKIEARVIEPAIRGMRREGMPFKGVLYAGLMMTEEGPMTLEFNVRFGDPESQVVLPRLKNDLVELMFASCEERLNDIQLIWDKRACVTVVMSSGGYPGEYESGKEIKGLDQFKKDENTIIFHAGTKSEGDKVVTAGGRVLAMTCFGKTMEKAIEDVYKKIEKIKFERCFFRRDIGAKALIIGHRSQAAGHR